MNEIAMFTTIIRNVSSIAVKPPPDSVAACSGFTYVYLHAKPLSDGYDIELLLASIMDVLSTNVSTNYSLFAPINDDFICTSRAIFLLYPNSNVVFVGSHSRGY